MSPPIAQHNELQERVPLPAMLDGTTFVSDSGRIYRLFGNEEETLVLPSIPELPPILAALKAPEVVLAEALQQIDAFFATTEHKNTQEQLRADFSTLQLFPTLGKSAPPRLVRREESLSNTVLPAKAIIDEVLQTSPHLIEAGPKKTSPREERATPLRVVSETVVEEPFIVPFAMPEVALEEPEEQNLPLRIVTELVPPILFPPILFPGVFQKCWHRRKKKTLYHKQCLPPPVRVSQTEESPVIAEAKPTETKPTETQLTVDTPTFRWSEQLNSLMQTAGNQIRMLTDHLIVQSNQGIKAICFKGVFPGDGCSTILLCAARALMEREYRVLLLDTHHRHIDLPKQLNLSNGLSSGNLNSEGEVIALEEYLGLWVWQESKTSQENAALLTELITAHREEYDLILLDDGSVTESPLMEFVDLWDSVELDGVILVSNTKSPTEIPVSHIAERFRQHHIHLIGVTENYV